ncbi:MAG: hypothetical protein AAGB00_09555, partial [Planctomycetota bacterium]
AAARGSVRYLGRIKIELGGLTAGSQFDQLNHALGAGVAQRNANGDVVQARQVSTRPEKVAVSLDELTRRRAARQTTERHAQRAALAP